ncbi:MAG: thiamine pyrophosphate-dependent enzyme [Desulfobacterales bacterium]|nr:thiamine pyrophosphate-dependent enzyme [Desulfobacterales bacterium]
MNQNPVKGKNPNRPVLLDKPLPYCPGCGHGIINRLLSEAISELGIREKSIGVVGIGCYTIMHKYLKMDTFCALHGRAVAVSTGIKRSRPENVVFTYQGDGDCAAIGMGELVHAAGRGENITVIMVNNGVYGMTGGQMSPTTLMGQKTSTTPLGREPRNGAPLHVPEILSAIDCTGYVARVAVNTPRNVRKAKKSIIQAFQTQIHEKGFSFVEIVSQCPTHLRLPPVEAVDWVEDQMISEHRLRVFKTAKGDKWKKGL